MTKSKLKKGTGVEIPTSKNFWGGVMPVMKKVEFGVNATTFHHPNLVYVHNYRFVCSFCSYDKDSPEGKHKPKGGGVNWKSRD
jgi:hypothetical protein